MNEQQYSMLLDEIMEVPMYRGCYDAVNGSREFMIGIASVIEFIAYRAGRQDEAIDEFYANLEASENRTR